MKIGIDISGQFKKMTGIQHYVDSLLNSLMKLETKHKIIPLAPNIWSANVLDEHAGDGFAWRFIPDVFIDVAGNDFEIKTFPVIASNRVLARIARTLDGRITNPYKRRTTPKRTSRAYSRYDLVHIPEAHDLAFLKQPIKRSIITICDTTPITNSHTHDPVTIGTWKRYFAFARDKCARVLTISEYSKADIVEHIGVPADRIDVTPLAPRAATRRVTDGESLRQTLANFRLTDVPFVLYSGTLEPRKNLKRLVEAFARAVTEGRLPDHKLVLAGGNWDRYDLELRLYALECGLVGRVITTGYVSDAEMNVLMSSCAAFAYVSEYEGFGMPPLEAMVCGAPVMASNTTSLPEVVGDAGIQVDPADVGAIAGALHRLLTDGAENARRRALSLERAKLFSWERTARLTLQSYEAALLQ